MKVQVNSKEVETTTTTITQLTDELQLPTKGVAIAVNNQMIPRTQWDEFSLQKNDCIVIIQAACGG